MCVYVPTVETAMPALFRALAMDLSEILSYQILSVSVG